MHTIILITHGPLAQALLASAEMIVGEQMGVRAICLGHKDNLDTARGRVVEALRESGDGALVLADLLGGTAANAAAWALQEHEFALVVGANLPMLLEVLLNRDSLSLEELAALAVRIGRQSVTDLGAMIRADQPSASAIRKTQKRLKAEG